MRMPVVVITTGAVDMVLVAMAVVRRLVRLMRMSVRVQVFMGMRMVVAMVMVTTPMLTISTVLWLKAVLYFVHDQMHGAQHIGQHMVGLDFQMVGLQLNGHMAVAQVVGSACQVKRRAVLAAMGDAQHRLGCGKYFEQRTVFTHQHIATAHHLAAL